MSYETTWSNQKLNKNEINKLKTDGLDIFKALPELVKQPFSDIDKSYYMYFKYAGLTVQKPQNAGLFMMRIKVPGGIMTTAQAHHLVKIANDYADGILDITTRQSVQYHHIKFKQIPEIFAGIEAVGMTTQGAEGDILRNVINNPLAGIDRAELFDTRDIVREVCERFEGNRDYSNEPRKLKISINSNYYNAGNAEVNDIAFTPATKEINGWVIKGFHVKIGGSLGIKPFLGVQADVFVLPQQVADFSEVVAALYRDHGYRRSRTKARLKFLIQDWGIKKFEEKIREKMPELLSRGHDETIGWNDGRVLGVAEQKQDGLYYIGASVPAGRISATDFEQFIKIAEQYGNGELRFDHAQNIIIPNISKAAIEYVKKMPLFKVYRISPTRLIDFGQTCTGATYCNLAFTRTKEILAPLLAPLLTTLDEEISLPEPVSITLTGCGNGCAHRSTADIGLEGCNYVTPSKEKIEGFQISVGGSLLKGGHFSENLSGKIPLNALHDTLLAFLNDFKKNRSESESFHGYYNRVGTAYFQVLLNQIIRETGDLT